MRQFTAQSAVAGLMALLVFACTTTSKTNYQASTVETTAVQVDEDLLKHGMTMLEVREAWGDPRETVVDTIVAGREFWFYERARSTGNQDRAIVTKIQYKVTIQDSVVTVVEEKPM